MKNAESLLARIFALSRRAPDPIPSELPFGLETAVLAHWRSANQLQLNGGKLGVLKWAAGIACAAALLSATLQHDELARLSHTSDLQSSIADSAVAAGFNYE